MDEIKKIIKETVVKFDKIIEYFSKDISTIRTGRANPSLVENILVDSYGTKMSLKQAASISVPAPRMIVIQPWDRSMIPNIEKAISQSELGIHPVSEGELIRIPLPSLTEEYRKKLIRLLNDKSEEARVSLRKTREDAWKDIQEGFKKGIIREDDKFRGKDELQKVIDDYNKKIEEITEKKNKEILEI